MKPLIFFAYALFFRLAASSSPANAGEQVHAAALIPPELELPLLQDFKVLLMYFSEPFLSGAKLAGKVLEGEQSLNMVKLLVDTLDTFTDTDHLDLDLIAKFNAQLTAGTEIYKSIILAATLSKTENDFKTIKAHSIAIQKDFTESMKDGIIIPSGWVKHGIALVIKPSASGITGLLDLTVVNTGSGIEFHYNSPVAGSIYPVLSEIWMEFKNVPTEEIFPPENPWFIYGLILLQREDFVKSLKENSEVEASSYFYETFLSNLKKFLYQQPEPNPYADAETADSRILVPMQRSGSCALSSLMGAFLYTAESLESFEWHRLHFGQRILERFLDKLAGDDSTAFKREILSDGFGEGSGRSFFRRLKSSLTFQLLQFLETKFPEQFSHAGLIGSERAAWLSDRKAAAVALLQGEGHQEVLQAIKTSIQLAGRIETILHENPIRMETTSLVPIDSSLKDEGSSIYKPVPGSLVFESSLDYEMKIDEYTRPAKFEAIPEALSVPKIENFNDLYDRFTKAKAYTINDRHFFKRFMNIFSAIESVEIEFRVDDLDRILGLQEICRQLAREAATRDRIGSISFDKIVLLWNFQSFSWTLFVNYHNLTFPEDQLPEGAASCPPQTLESVLFPDSKFNLLAGNVSPWPVRNIFDARSEKTFLKLLKKSKECRVKFSDPECQVKFSGPECFGSVETKKFTISSDTLYPEDKIHDKLAQHRIIEEILASLRNNNDSSTDGNELCSKWKELSNYDAKLLILMLGIQPELQNLFPHYYKLMDTLASIRIAAADFRHNVDFQHPENWIVSSSAPSDKELTTVFPTSKITNYEAPEILAITSQSVLHKFGANRPVLEVFFWCRHSYALPASIVDIDIETWLNYIKSARSARIFDDLNFQYLTDHILNVPKFAFSESLGVVENNIWRSERRFAQSVVNELIFLVSSSLSKLADPKLKQSDRKIIVKRAGDISILLLRFVSRLILLKHDKSVLSSILADFYRTLLPYSRVDSIHFKLLMADISVINFAMSFTCSVAKLSQDSRPGSSAVTSIEPLEPLQNPEQLEPLEDPETLETFHWFVAQMTRGIIDSSVTDDQLKNHSIPRPLCPESKEFFTILLNHRLIPDYFRDFSMETVEINGYFVELENEHTRIVLNLATGEVMNNGQIPAKREPFINSPQFQKFFPPEFHHKAAVVGTCQVLEDYRVFYLPNFKDSVDYFLIWDTTNYLANTVKILRKWNESWYTWMDAKENGILNHFGFNWLKEDVQVFKSNNRENKTAELLLFHKQEPSDPFLRFFVKEIKIAAEEDEEVTEEDVTEEEEVTEGEEGEGGNDLGVTSFLERYLEIPGLLKSNRLIVLNEISAIGLFDRHIKAFALSDEFIPAIYRNNGDAPRLAAVFPGLRIAGDQQSPFTLLESSNSYGTFRVENMPDLSICSDQRVGVGSAALEASLQGGLVAVQEGGGKKVLLLPQVSRAEPAKSSAGYIQVQIIPIVEMHSLAPQSRVHKLLLAYYMLHNQNFEAARKLLHPATSIYHNDPFSLEELEIIEWIAKIETALPEVLALRLVVLVHYFINKSKFPRYYEKLIDCKTGPMLKIKMSAFSYMMAIRELAEKFYIHKIFPEILFDPRKTLFEEVFERVRHFSFETRTRPDFIQNLKITTKKLDDDHLFRYTPFQKVQAKTLQYHLLQIDSNDLDAQKQKEEMNLYRYLMSRRFSNQNRDSSFEMFFYCLAADPGMWTEFGALFRDDQEQITEDHLNYLLGEQLARCQEKFRTDFESISPLFNTRMISLNSINTILALDLNNKSYTNDHKGNKNLMVFKQEHVDFLNGLRTDLLKIINSTKVPVPVVTEFFKFAAKSSVLLNLSQSIANFIQNSPQTSLHEVQLSELRNVLDQLDVFFTTQISDLIASQGRLLQELSRLLIVDNTIEQMFTLMHDRKQKLFPELYACYLRDSLSCIQRKFPQLSIEQCQVVRKDTVVFYSQKILIDYFTMLQKSVKVFLSSDATVDVDDLFMFCDELGKISKFNDRLKNPVVMNFEFQSGKYRLKSEQVADIELLTSESSDNFDSVVIQRMMAAGKTLVLGTISVVTKALTRPDRLSILVPPASLYQSNTTAMQNRTYQYFKKKGNTFNFPRFPLQLAAPLRNYLETVMNTINYTMHNRDYLILNPDDLHSFLNSFIEIIPDSKGKSFDNVQLEILKLYARIYQIFKTKTSVIFDEIDMTMDPKRELNYPTIETESLNMTAVAMLADILEFMVFDERIKDAGLNIHSNNQAALTPENYCRCREIVLDYIRSQFDDKTSMWAKNIPADRLDPAMAFLKNPEMSAEKEWITQFHDSQHQAAARALIIVKAQLYLHLEDNFKGTVNQNYGSAGKARAVIKYAVPFVAANTPSPGSVFSDRWETLVKTLLMVSASPCSTSTTRLLINYVRRSMLKESSGRIALEETATYRNLKLILPSNWDPMLLDENNQVEIEILHKNLSKRSPAAIRLLYSYFINDVLAKMSFPVEQITSNALHVASMFASVQGYSGTIDNVNILPQRVVAAAHIDHKANEKNNGGIVLELIKDSKDGKVKIIDDNLFLSSSTEMVTELFRLFDGSRKVSAVIDTGAFFKNYTNRQVAEAIWTFYADDIEVVLYYDEGTNELEFVRGSKDHDDGRISFTYGLLKTTDPDDIEKSTGAAIEKRFTFYDQRHITGSDILQPKHSHAILTVGPRALLRDILQGTLRMRQFMTSQIVHLVSTAASVEFYKNKVSPDQVTDFKVSDVLTLGAMNEDEKQAHENEKLAYVKIDTEIREFVLDEISRIVLKTKNTAASWRVDAALIDSLFDSTRDLFIRSIREDPLIWLCDRKSDDTHRTLARYARSKLRKLDGLQAKGTKLSGAFYAMKRRIAAMINNQLPLATNSLLFYLKETIMTRVSDSDAGTEVLMQTQTEMLNLADLQLNQLVSVEPANAAPIEHDMQLMEQLIRGNSLIPLTACTYTSFEHLYGTFKEPSLQSQNYSNQQNYHRQNQHHSLAASALFTDGKSVGVTLDLIQIYEPPSPNSVPFPIFSKFTLEGSHLLIRRTKIGNVHVLLISPAHARAAKLKLKFNPKAPIRKMHFWLCDLAGTVNVSNDPGTISGQSIFSIVPEATNLIFDALVFNGSLPQILATPCLENVYQNLWLRDNNKFKERAKFLLLRMMILLQKDASMFDEDDVELGRLRLYALGDRNPEQSVEGACDQYPKGVVDETLQSNYWVETQANVDLHEVEKDPAGIPAIQVASDPLIKAVDAIYKVSRYNYITDDHYELPNNGITGERRTPKRGQYGYGQEGDFKFDERYHDDQERESDIDEQDLPAGQVNESDNDEWDPPVDQESEFDDYVRDPVVQVRDPDAQISGSDDQGSESDDQYWYHINTHSGDQYIYPDISASHGQEGGSDGKGDDDIITQVSSSYGRGESSSYGKGDDSITQVSSSSDGKGEGSIIQDQDQGSDSDSQDQDSGSDVRRSGQNMYHPISRGSGPGKQGYYPDCGSDGPGSGSDVPGRDPNDQSGSDRPGSGPNDEPSGTDVRRSGQNMYHPITRGSGPICQASGYSGEQGRYYPDSKVYGSDVEDNGSDSQDQESGADEPGSGQRSNSRSEKKTSDNSDVFRWNILFWIVIPVISCFVICAIIYKFAHFKTSEDEDEVTSDDDYDNGSENDEEFVSESEDDEEKIGRIEPKNDYN